MDRTGILACYKSVLHNSAYGSHVFYARLLQQRCMRVLCKYFVPRAMLIKVMHGVMIEIETLLHLATKPVMVVVHVGCLGFLLMRLQRHVL